jgi:hypothetical protein
MTRSILKTILIVTTGLIPPAFAAPVDECLPFLRNCLMKTDTKRDECLASLKSSPICAASTSLDLLRRRNLLSPRLPEGPAFLGPQETNRTCIDRFDRQWLKTLTETPTSLPEHRTLEDSISRCEQEPAIDLYRP